jgi:hypothetical protein
MSRRRGTQVLVHRLERSKESDEGPSQMLGRRTSLSKITVPKLIGNGNHRRAHGSIFMRALCPGGSALLVNPDREAHACSSAQAVERVLTRASLSPFFFRPDQIARATANTESGRISANGRRTAGTDERLG